MKPKLSKTSKFFESYRFEHGKDFRLKDVDPADTQGLDLKGQTKDVLEKGIARLSDLQQKLYAQDEWAVLVILQGTDAAGKDSVIRHVMSGVNPQGCEVYSFKEPSQEDLDHDFLWRASKLLPRRGRIGIFNRSYYEEVLVVRVHPELLRNERIPHSMGNKKIWKERFEDINSFETHLNRNGVLLVKFFLYVSKEEQKKRCLSRLDEPEKNWKFSEADVREREHWEDYMQSYEDMVRHTATSEAPWFVVPADHKWFTRMVVAAVIIHTLESLRLTYPRVDAAKRKELDAARKLLLNES